MGRLRISLPPEKGSFQEAFTSLQRNGIIMGWILSFAGCLLKGSQCENNMRRVFQTGVIRLETCMSGLSLMTMQIMAADYSGDGMSEFISSPFYTSLLHVRDLVD